MHIPRVCKYPSFGWLSAVTYGLACLLVVLPSCNSNSAPRAPAVVSPPPKTIVRPPTKPLYECRWTDQPIKIDGVADEPAWKNAQVIDHFMIPGKHGNPREATSARLLWDNDYLYYFALMQDSDIYADVTEHNGLVYTNDCFEIFLRPSDEKTAYYEFEVNPLNTTMELFLPSRNSGGWQRYRHSTDIQHTTAIKIDGTINHWQDTDRSWAVEGRIRWSDLAATGGRPGVGDTWGFSACRVDIGKGIDGEELSSCSPLTRPDFHHYEDYARLKFVHNDTAGQGAIPAADEIRPYAIATPTPWTTSAVVGFPDPPLPYTATKAFPKLSVFQPLAVFEEPGTDTCLVLQHLGSWEGPSRVQRFHNDPAADSAEPLLQTDELIYGMTLHPDFAHNGYIYLLANGPMGTDNRQDRIVRYTVDRKSPFQIDPKSRLVILEWDSNGHNGGDLGFGPDGNLYHASGDGTSDSDTNDRGQNTDFLTSKMIRIDVDHPTDGKPYSIPKDNPWINTPGFRPEVWAYGFRNPWRLAFDRKAGDLWVGQNGQDLWEAVYLVHKGENYGWSRYEGSHEFQTRRKPAPTPVTFPIVEHPHSEMRSLTGGIVYRGSKFPGLDGAFIYGDWSTGRIFGVKSADHKTATWQKELARTTLQISGFRETAAGDILIMDQGGAAIYKLIPNTQTAPAKPFPQKLSETGLFLSTKDNKPDPALIPYDVNAPLWSDGAMKERFIAIPAGGHIDATAAHGWNFPEGACLVKTFSLELEQGKPASRKRIETRLITKQLGQWIGYTYLWNDEQTDAVLAPAAGVDKTYTILDADAPEGKRTQAWHFPSRTECMTCHARAVNFVLGLSTLQMNRDYVYPNGVKDNQIRELQHLGLLVGDPGKMEHLVDPYDEQADLTARARSYLHSNCGICHFQAGGGNSLMTLDFALELNELKAVGAKPQHETFGIARAQIISPGSADTSILFHRMNIRGTGQMPPLASSRVDVRAVKMLRAWIESLPADNTK